MIRVIPVLLALAGVLAAACGDGAGTPSATRTPTQPLPSPTPAATATPAPSPTPLGGAVPEGWERHTTANIQIDLPETWDTFDPTEETVEAILEEIRRRSPEFASMAEQLLGLEEFEFSAFDTEAVQLINNVIILTHESPFPIAVPALVAQFEAQAADLDIRVLSTDSDLTIGGLRAAKILSSQTVNSFEIRTVQYLVLPEPTVAFALTFSTGTTDFERLAPAFEQIAQSFRVLGSP